MRSDHDGARRGVTIFYTLVETAKLHDVDPAVYLRAAILAADRGEILLPWQLPRSPPAASAIDR